MSNRRRPHGSRIALPRCGSCGGAVRQGTMSQALADGRVICTRCVQGGVLCRQLPCGHMGVPGMTVISDSADQSNFKCVRCSPHAAPGILAEGRR